jgi:hypothetical protein
MEGNMKTRIAVLAFAALLSLSVEAKPPAPKVPASGAVADESQLVDHGHYVNNSGAEVHSPAHSKTGAPPSGATAKCRDGTFSFSQHHRGTCSHHGGVATWFQ